MASTINTVTRGKGPERWIGTWPKRMAATTKGTGTTATWLINNINTVNNIRQPVLLLLLTTTAAITLILLTFLIIIPSDLERCLRWLR